MGAGAAGTGVGIGLVGFEFSLSTTSTDAGAGSISSILSVVGTRVSVVTVTGSCSVTDTVTAINLS